MIPESIEGLPSVTLQEAVAITKLYERWEEFDPELHEEEFQEAAMDLFTRLLADWFRNPPKEEC